MEKRKRGRKKSLREGERERHDKWRVSKKELNRNLQRRNRG